MPTNLTPPPCRPPYIATNINVPSSISLLTRFRRTIKQRTVRIHKLKHQTMRPHMGPHHPRQRRPPLTRTRKPTIRRVQHKRSIRLITRHPNINRHAKRIQLLRVPGTRPSTKGTQIRGLRPSTLIVKSTQHIHSVSLRSMITLIRSTIILRIIRRHQQHSIKINNRRRNNTQRSSQQTINRLTRRRVRLSTFNQRLLLRLLHTLSPNRRRHSGSHNRRRQSVTTVRHFRSINMRRSSLSHRRERRSPRRHNPTPIPHVTRSSSNRSQNSSRITHRHSPMNTNRPHQQPRNRRRHTSTRRRSHISTQRVSLTRLPIQNILSFRPQRRTRLRHLLQRQRHTQSRHLTNSRNNHNHRRRRQRRRPQQHRRRRQIQHHLKIQRRRHPLPRVTRHRHQGRRHRPQSTSQLTTRVTRINMGHLNTHRNRRSQTRSQRHTGTILNSRTYHTRQIRHLRSANIIRRIRHARRHRHSRPRRRSQPRGPHRHLNSQSLRPRRHSSSRRNSKRSPTNGSKRSRIRPLSNHRRQRHKHSRHITRRRQRTSSTSRVRPPHPPIRHTLNLNSRQRNTTLTTIINTRSRRRMFRHSSRRRNPRRRTSSTSSHNLNRIVLTHIRGQLTRNVRKQNTSITVSRTRNNRSRNHTQHHIEIQVQRQINNQQSS